MRTMFDFGWLSVGEFSEGSFDVSGNREIDRMDVVVPIERDATEEGGIPIRGDFFVVGLERVLQVESVFLSDIVDEEIVNDEGERDGATGVSLKDGCMRCLKVPILGEDILELLVCHHTGLWKAVHAATNVDVCESIGGVFVELVLLDDFGGNEVHRYFHVFVLR